jgi:hypothetical protein
VILCMAQTETISSARDIELPDSEKNGLKEMRLNLEKGVVDCVRLRALPATIFVLIIISNVALNSLTLLLDPLQTSHIVVISTHPNAAGPLYWVTPTLASTRRPSFDTLTRTITHTLTMA